MLAARVAGDSMRPTYGDGEVVHVDTGAYRVLPPRPGDVVLARHPFRSGVHLVKRVESVTADGRVVLIGDDPAASTDSRSFGALKREAILGRVTGKAESPRNTPCRCLDCV